MTNDAMTNAPMTNAPMTKFSREYIGNWSLVIHWSLVIGHWSLVTGHWSLVIGHWSLVIGHWSLVIGHWSLVIGHWSLVISPRAFCKMLQALVTFSLRFRGVVIALACLLLGYGFYVAKTAKLDVFPNFVQPQVVIQTEAPGLSPEQVEALVTRPVETMVNGLG